MVKYFTEKKQEVRKEEIIDACEKLYENMSFKEITMKEISKETSFTRPSIYNYFHTKEEIFLALLQREYNKWYEELQSALNKKENPTAEGFADLIASSLKRRERLLKLLSINYYEMEENSRVERLTDFKATFGRAFDCFVELLHIYFSSMTAKEQDDFLIAFFPFMFGIYPYTHITEKQKTAMETAGLNFSPRNIYDIVYGFIIKTLK